LKKFQTLAGLVWALWATQVTARQSLLGAFICGSFVKPSRICLCLFKTKKGNKMTIEIAALLGMGLIALWGLIALLFAIKSAKTNHNLDTGAIHSN
jgi:hypothetical protein